MSSSKSRLVSVTYADQKAWGISLRGCATIGTYQVSGTTYTDFPLQPETSWPHLYRWSHSMHGSSVGSYETFWRLHEDAMDLGWTEESSRGDAAGARVGWPRGGGCGSPVEPASHVKWRRVHPAGEPQQFRPSGEEGIAVGRNHYFVPRHEDQLSGRG